MHSLRVRDRVPVVGTTGRQVRLDLADALCSAALL